MNAVVEVAASAGQAAATRTDREVFNATRPFAHESRAKSWGYLISTFLILGGTLSIAVAAPWWPLKLVTSCAGGLLMVRAFILYHDFMHGAILNGSFFAKAILYLYGCALVTAPSSWRETHNYHHANIAKIGGPAIGSFPILLLDEWRKASRAQRLWYRVGRHPITILSAYLTVFMVSICLVPFFRDPRKHFDSVAAVAIHFSIVALLWMTLGPSAVLFGFMLPLWIASALGAYLFYAQHNFPGMKLLPPAQWTYFRAALESSSFMKLSPVLRWFTGDIGYHHVHHLNSKIPFYRLREAMVAIPELQNPSVTTLSPRNILACLQLDLWDPSKGRMISFREADDSCVRT